LGTGQKFFNDFSELVWISIYAKSLKSLANLAETVQTDPGSRPLGRRTWPGDSLDLPPRDSARLGSGGLGWLRAQRPCLENPKHGHTWPPPRARVETVRITALHMLRSTITTVSAPANSSFRGSITHPTQPLCTLRVRRYRRLTQHSLPGDLLGLTWAGLAPADRASFAWRLRRGRDASYLASPAQIRT